MTFTFAVNKGVGDEEYMRKLGDYCDQHHITMYTGDNGEMIGFYFSGSGPAIEELNLYLANYTA